MVCLPTGLGKTFIAAVVMFNFYRWFPQSKVIFMAPTRPLVTQQLEACYNIMGVPQEHMSMMLGTVHPTTRRERWSEKRMFFVTPQIVNNDINSGLVDPRSIVCLVVDEAHRARGNQAYCQVMREMAAATRHFRVLALTATPGSNVENVQDVVSNLLIAHIEIRRDGDIDVQRYVQSRQLDVVPVQPTPVMNDLHQRLDAELERPMAILRDMGAVPPTAQRGHFFSVTALQVRPVANARHCLTSSASN